ncbi:hypothetical protein ACW7GZ_14745 [Luteimonas sp. A537]
MKAFTMPVTAIILTMVLAGCVSMPQKTGDLRSVLGARPLAESLLDMAEKCWAREATFFRDGIVVEDRVGVRGTVISAFRRGGGIPDQPEFLILTINDAADGGANVEVKEGDYAIGSQLNLTSDVDRWVAGDLSCSVQDTK